MPQSVLRRKIGFWQTQGVLLEEETDVFVLVEDEADGGAGEAGDKVGLWQLRGFGSINFMINYCLRRLNRKVTIFIHFNSEYRPV